MISSPSWVFKKFGLSREVLTSVSSSLNSMMSHRNHVLFESEEGYGESFFS